MLVTVDSTVPSVTLGDLGSLVRGVVTLAASTQGAAVTQVVFKRKPSGGASWTALETDTAGPWNAAFDTNAVSDGTYDLRAEALDSIGTVLAGHTRENVRVDNTAPVVQSASPADGSSVSSATSIVLVANEAVAAVRGATLDGAVTTPEIAGTRVTFATGSLALGDHTLVGSIEDAAGNASGFRVQFSVRAAAPTALALQIGKPTSTKRGRNQIFSLRVTLSAPARVQLTLLSPTGRRLRTTKLQLPAGGRVVSLSVPRASLPPGRYTMLVTATTPDGTQVLRRAQVVIKKAKQQKKRKRPANTQAAAEGRRGAARRRSRAPGPHHSCKYQQRRPRAVAARDGRDGRDGREAFLALEAAGDRHQVRGRAAAPDSRPRPGDHVDGRRDRLPDQDRARPAPPLAEAPRQLERGLDRKDHGDRQEGDADCAAQALLAEASRCASAEPRARQGPGETCARGGPTRPRAAAHERRTRRHRAGTRRPDWFPPHGAR